MAKAATLKATQTSGFVKRTKLYVGIIFDLIGMTPTIFPPLALIWAPFSGFVLATMYKGKLGKAAGIFEFAEALIPIVNFIPTFTLTWLYVYEIKGEE